VLFSPTGDPPLLTELLALKRPDTSINPPPLAQVLGKGLCQLPREEIVVATKVGRYGPDTFDFR
jgi:hypothetical protein